METTDGQNMNWKKEEVFALMDEKKRIEKEMAEWTEVLNNEGGVGLHEPLVDEEGNLNIYMLLDNAIVLLTFNLQMLLCDNTHFPF